MINTIKLLFEQYFGEQAQQIEALPQSGSGRQYFRVQSKTHSAIAAYHSDQRENQAFIQLTQHFQALGLNVPQIYAYDLDKNTYLQQDLGDETLLHKVKQRQNEANNHNKSEIEQDISQFYRAVIDQLVQLQVRGHQGLDYEKIAIGRIHFDQQALLWDMQYFKYCFLKPSNIAYNEQALEDNFKTLAQYLCQANTHFFMLRDCQARNIMWHNHKPYFIDYQGGMQGALQYDLASLLFQAQAKLSPQLRAELLDYYTTQLQNLQNIDEKAFKDMFYGYALARTLQVLGAYGLRGLYEQKAHFLQSIPSALHNLRHLLQSNSLPFALPELNHISQQLLQINWQEKIKLNPTNTSNYVPTTHNIANKVATDAAKPALNIRINSFSYRVGVPPDPTEHGVGFVFDCRSIHNPGRYEPYKKLTGKDQAVIHFLETETEVAHFLRHTFALLDKAVEEYSARGFEHLSVNFGCTGGQHRSVYCAEMTAQHLQQKYGITAILNHCNQQNWQR
jgi:aminoglycoside/choline kinase family phosphotransferase